MLNNDRNFACRVRSFWGSYLPPLTLAAWMAVSAFAGGPDSSAPDPNILAKQVIENEVHAQTADDSLWHYREIDQEDGKVETLDVCQTKQGEIDRLVAVDGKPLSPKQSKTEDQRIDRLLNDRAAWDSLEKKRHSDADQERNLLKSFPGAFYFEYRGHQGNLVTLSFSPNPTFRPSSHEQLVFHHMEGDLKVDLAQKRIAEINGRLTSEVRFLGGLLGHLDEGGTFFVRQQDFGSSRWEMTFMNVQMDGKALFFKTIAVRQREVFSNFEPVPANITPIKAAELLKHDVTLSADRSPQGL